MLKHKLMLPILAVIVGGAASAFTTVNSHQHSNADPFWYKVDPSSHQVLQVIGQESEDKAKADTGCEDNSQTLCAYGYTTDPSYNVGDIAAQGDQSFNQTQP